MDSNSFEFTIKNHFFIHHVRELMDEASQRGSKLYFTYRKALSSLIKYPLVLSSGKECEILEGFGPKMCSMLDTLLTKFAESNGINIEEALFEANSLFQEETARLNSKTMKLCRKRQSDNTNYGPLTKKPSISKNSPKSRSSLDSVVTKKCFPNSCLSPSTVTPSNILNSSTSPTLPIQFSYVDANGILVASREKSLKRETGENDFEYRIRCNYKELTAIYDIEYSLDWSTSASKFAPHYSSESEPTKENKSSKSNFQEFPPSETELQPIIPAKKIGRIVEKPSRLSNTLYTNLPIPEVQSLMAACSSNDINVGKTYTSYIIPGGSYEVILLLDSRENFGMGKLKEILLPTLTKRKIPCEVRVLPVGDFAWIARRKASDGAIVNEAIFDCLLERKKADDLASSIISGRLEEQKSRLSATGFSNCIIMFEKCPGFRKLSIGLPTMFQSLSNSEVLDDFHVITSEGTENTIEILIQFTKNLSKRSNEDILVYRETCETNGPFKQQILSNLTALDWEEYLRVADKNPDPTVKELFARQLLQIPGVSGPIAEAIFLLEAYESCSNDEEKEKMLLGLRHEKGAISTSISKIIYHVYNI